MKVWKRYLFEKQEELIAEIQDREREADGEAKVEAKAKAAKQKKKQRKKQKRWKNWHATHYILHSIIRLLHYQLLTALEMILSNLCKVHFRPKLA